VCCYSSDRGQVIGKIPPETETNQRSFNQNRTLESVIEVSRTMLKVDMERGGSKVDKARHRLKQK